MIWFSQKNNNSNSSLSSLLRTGLAGLFFPKSFAFPYLYVIIHILRSIYYPAHKHIRDFLSLRTFTLRWQLRLLKSPNCKCTLIEWWLKETQTLLLQGKTWQIDQCCHWWETAPEGIILKCIIFNVIKRTFHLILRCLAIFVSTIISGAYRTKVNHTN